MAGFILLLHVAGWGLLAGLAASEQLPGAASHAFGLGLGLTAYTLGMRHAFDADHIAAIDNTTRTQLAEGGRPLSVGFWFSLGHSSVVFVLVALLALGVRSLAGQLDDQSSALQQWAGLFLVLIGLLNLIVLAGILSVFMRMRRGGFDERRSWRPGWTSAASSPGSSDGPPGGSPSPGTCTRWGCCSAWGSTPPPRWACWSSPVAQQ